MSEVMNNRGGKEPLPLTVKEQGMVEVWPDLLKKLSKTGQKNLVARSVLSNLLHSSSFLKISLKTEQKPNREFSAQFMNNHSLLLKIFYRTEKFLSERLLFD